jgi:hypothetical protein
MPIYTFLKCKENSPIGEPFGEDLRRSCTYTYS